MIFQGLAEIFRQPLFVPDATGFQPMRQPHRKISQQRGSLGKSIPADLFSVVGFAPLQAARPDPHLS